MTTFRRLTLLIVSIALLMASKPSFAQEGYNCTSDSLVFGLSGWQVSSGVFESGVGSVGLLN